MKIILATIFAVMTTTSVALAADPLSLDRTGPYVGISAGKFVNEQNQFNLGAQAGYQLSPYFRAELDYNNAWQTNSTNGQTLFGNAIIQYRLPNSTFTPYVLAGVGMGFNELGQVKTGSANGLYDLGVGARVAITKQIEIDARYATTQPINSSSSKSENTFTVGVNYRF